MRRHHRARARRGSKGFVSSHLHQIKSYTCRLANVMSPLRSGNNTKASEREREKVREKLHVADIAPATRNRSENINQSKSFSTKASTTLTTSTVFDVLLSRYFMPSTDKRSRPFQRTRSAQLRLDSIDFWLYDLKRLLHGSSSLRAPHHHLIIRTGETEKSDENKFPWGGEQNSTCWFSVNAFPLLNGKLSSFRRVLLLSKFMSWWLLSDEVDPPQWLELESRDYLIPEKAFSLLTQMWCGRMRKRRSKES